MGTELSFMHKKVSPGYNSTPTYITLLVNIFIFNKKRTCLPHIYNEISTNASHALMFIYNAQVSIYFHTYLSNIYLSNQ